MAIINATDASFEQDVLQSDKLVLVVFWAEWCGPCKMLAPVLDEVEAEVEEVQVVKVNIEESPEAPVTYAVRGIPALFLFKNGEIVAQKAGAMPKSELVAWIDQHK